MTGPSAVRGVLRRVAMLVSPCWGDNAAATVARPRLCAASTFEHTMTRVKRILLWGTFSVAAMVGSGLLLADQLTPAANGVPSHALPLSPDQTVLDRELAPLLARNPGKTGALMLTDGIDAFAARDVRPPGLAQPYLQYYIWHDDLTAPAGARGWLAAEPAALRLLRRHHAVGQ